MKSKISFTMALLGTVLGSGVLFNACTLKNACDDGYTQIGSECVLDEVDGSGGSEGGDGDGGAGGAGGDVSMGGSGTDEPDPEPVTMDPNPGDACTTNDECFGGTFCETDRTNSCVALCGPDDPFADGCPGDLACTDFGQAMVCFGG